MRRLRSYTIAYDLDDTLAAGVSQVLRVARKKPSIAGRLRERLSSEPPDD
jgi:hypothetical protein